MVDVPRNQWHFPEGHKPDQRDWHERFGDRTQQIVFIGQNMNETELRKRLDQCLRAEIANADSTVWAQLPNPSRYSIWLR